MNNPISPRPRFACHVVRQWCAVVESARPRHVSRCADCRAFFASGEALETTLRRDAGTLSRADVTASDALERRIIQAVRNSARPVVTERSSAWRGAWAMAAAAAVAVAVGVGVFSRNTRSTDAAVTAGTELLTDAVETVSRGLVDSVIPSAGALAADNPLQREFDAIVVDARSALGFLALNFLPSVNANIPPAPARRS